MGTVRVKGPPSNEGSRVFFETGRCRLLARHLPGVEQPLDLLLAHQLLLPHEFEQPLPAFERLGCQLSSP